MNKNNSNYKLYIKIIEEELIPALGCTEPIAVAFAAAKARETLGKMPERIEVSASRNIIKNVKGAVVPNTKDLRGISTSAVLGIIAGKPENNLEVLEGVKKEDLIKANELIKNGFCSEKILKSKANLHIIVKAYAGKDSSEVELMHTHTKITKIIKNNKIIFKGNDNENDFNESLTDRSILSLKSIYDFIQNFDIEDLKAILDLQIQYNMAIAEEGIKNNYGASVGKTILENYENNTKNKAKAYAAAGSDARMSGCTLPVIINSGSGNQGITLSVPVIVYARDMKCNEEKLYRALALSNLIAIHQKTGIGRLSAFCGAVNAGVGAGAGITYLCDGNFDDISRTIVNILANVSGMVCDGAKPSCAIKIATVIDAAILGYEMAIKKRTFHSGEGLVKETVEDTINTICTMGREGMKETDVVILKLMMKE